MAVGERQRVEIIKALYRDASILILDEPTAVLTPKEVDDLFETFKQMVQDGRSLIFISHKLHEVLTLSDRITVLRNGRVTGQTDPCDTNREKLAHHFPDELDLTLALLTRRELIELTDVGYRFQVELIRRWFAQKDR